MEATVNAVGWVGVVILILIGIVIVGLVLKYTGIIIFYIAMWCIRMYNALRDLWDFAGPLDAVNMGYNNTYEPGKDKCNTIIDSPKKPIPPTGPIIPLCPIRQVTFFGKIGGQDIEITKNITASEESLSAERKGLYMDYDDYRWNKKKNTAESGAFIGTETAKSSDSAIEIAEKDKTISGLRGLNNYYIKENRELHRCLKEANDTVAVLCVAIIGMLIVFIGTVVYNGYQHREGRTANAESTTYHRIVPDTNFNDCPPEEP